MLNVIDDSISLLFYSRLGSRLFLPRTYQNWIESNGLQEWSIAKVWPMHFDCPRTNHQFAAAAAAAYLKCAMRIECDLSFWIPFDCLASPKINNSLFCQTEKFRSHQRHNFNSSNAIRSCAGDRILKLTNRLNAINICLAEPTESADGECNKQMCTTESDRDHKSFDTMCSCVQMRRCKWMEHGEQWARTRYAMVPFTCTRHELFEQFSSMNWIELLEAQLYRSSVNLIIVICFQLSPICGDADDIPIHNVDIPLFAAVHMQSTLRMTNRKPFFSLVVKW